MNPYEGLEPPSIEPGKTIDDYRRARAKRQRRRTVVVRIVRRRVIIRKRGDA